MLKKGFLASTNFYACIKHSDDVIDHYFDELEVVYGKIAKAEHGIIDANALLSGSVCHGGFKRLN